MPGITSEQRRRYQEAKRVFSEHGFHARYSSVLAVLVVDAAQWGSGPERAAAMRRRRLRTAARLRRIRNEPFRKGPEHAALDRALDVLAEAGAAERFLATLSVPAKQAPKYVAAIAERIVSPAARTAFWADILRCFQRLPAPMTMFENCEPDAVRVAASRGAALLKSRPVGTFEAMLLKEDRGMVWGLGRLSGGGVRAQLRRLIWLRNQLER